MSNSKIEPGKTYRNLEGKLITAGKEPASRPELEIEVGKTYFNRGGELQYIHRETGNPTWPFESEDGTMYREDGKVYASVDDRKDLVHEVVETPPSEQPFELKVGNVFQYTNGTTVTITRCERRLHPDDDGTGLKEYILVYIDAWDREVTFSPDADGWYTPYEKVFSTLEQQFDEVCTTDLRLEVGKSYCFDDTQPDVLIEEEWLVTTGEWIDSPTLLRGDNGLVYRKDGTCILFADRGSHDLCKESE